MIFGKKYLFQEITTVRVKTPYILTLMRMTKDEKGLAFFKGLLSKMSYVSKNSKKYLILF